MRWQFLLVPAALVASGPAMAGAYYLTLEEAQNLLFPGATFTEDFRTLTAQQMRDIFDDSRVKVRDPQLKVWRVSNGGWFILDHVLGRDDEVAYAVGLDANGGVTGIEILECWEEFAQVRQPEWLAQFKGRHHDQIALEHDIEIASGATLSSHHITEGMIRVLSTYVLVVNPPKL